MPRIVSYGLHAVELPFRGKFEHAASARESSSSLFVDLTLDDGSRGWGEALPRPYVTGETRDGACALLAGQVLPRLLGREFESFEDLHGFLGRCDGRAPSDWVDPATAQSAAWCAVDLALLDAFGHSFASAPFGKPAPCPPDDFRYSGVLSSGVGIKRSGQALAYRWLGFQALKIKLDGDTDLARLARIRRKVGRSMDLRADVNMGWDLARALEMMPGCGQYGVRSFEQPLPAEDLDGAARLVAETGLDVMADESFDTRESLEALIEKKACTAINARISKCGGLVATLARCREAVAAGLWVQVGCQVGESSVLSAAHLHLCSEFRQVRYAEGCFGRLLLMEDPASPLIQMRRGGVPPRLPSTPGIGVTMDEAGLARHRVGHWHSKGGAG